MLRQGALRPMVCGSMWPLRGTAVRHDQRGGHIYSTYCLLTTPIIYFSFIRQLRSPFLASSLVGHVGQSQLSPPVFVALKYGITPMRLPGDICLRAASRSRCSCTRFLYRKMVYGASLLGSYSFLYLKNFTHCW